MRLQVNGEPREFDVPMTVSSLVEMLGLDARKVAVERNLEIVPRSAYGLTMLGEGDRLEIVNFVGGG
jgi:thiamine biosynthesis protein ThiS